jgi:membrane protease YdiL (CAAX protease family)
MSPKTSFPPDGIRRWFIGPDGIRSGWRVLIFAVLAYSFQKLLGMLTLAIPFLAAPLRTIASGNFVASALFVLEIRNLASAALAALIMMRIEHHSFANYGVRLGEAFRSRFWQGWALGLCGAVLLFLLLRAESMFFFGNLVLAGREILTYAGKWAAGCVLVGLYEEFVFRGYVLHTLRTGMGFWGAAMLSSALFGAVHLGNGSDPWYIALSAATFGMLYCLSVFRTGGIWFAIGVHAAFDFSETFLFSPSGGLKVSGHLLNSSLNGPAWLTGGVAGPEASLNGVLIFVLLFLIVNRLGGTQRPRTAI